MSRETKLHLNTQVLRGFNDLYGPAWHRDLELINSLGMEDNHYPGAIPIPDLYRRLFNFAMEPRPVMIDTRAGLTTVDGQIAWVRNDTEAVMGIHSDSYNGADNQFADWCIRNIEQVVDDTIQVSSAGLLKGGAVAWVQIQRPENIITPEGVIIRPFIMATTSYDGSIASTMMDGFVDTVCDNTRDAFLAGGGQRYRVKRTRNGRFNVSSARDALGIINANTEDYLAEIAALNAAEVSDKQWATFVETLCPIEDGATGRSTTMAENKRSALTGLWNTDTRVTPWRNTAWGALQAVNTYTHHLATVRNMPRDERNFLRVVEGKTTDGDRAALAVLQTVLGRTIQVADRNPVSVSMATAA